jgi:urease subunit beta
MTRPLVPGEVETAEGRSLLNEGREAVVLMVANTGRPARAGGARTSTSPRPTRRSSSTGARRGAQARHPGGTAVRFEPGQRREVRSSPTRGSGWCTGSTGRWGAGCEGVDRGGGIWRCCGAAVADAPAGTALTQMELNVCASDEPRQADESELGPSTAWPSSARGRGRPRGAARALRRAQRAWDLVSGTRLERGRLTAEDALADAAEGIAMCDSTARRGSRPQRLSRRSDH